MVDARGKPSPLLFVFNFVSLTPDSQDANPLSEAEHPLAIYSNIHSRRNELALISKLPPEILSSIFILCSRNSLHRPSTQHPSTKTCILSWVASTTHVCQHWRNVGLACHDLWTSIHIPKEPECPWATELVRRAHNMPLFIRAWISFPSPVIIEQLHRLVDLELRAPLSVLQQLLPATSATQSAAPLLRRLQLDCTTWPLAGNHLTLPETIFGHNSPQLTELVLDDIIFHQWSSLAMWTNLTMLRVRYSQDDPIPVPTMGILLDVFESTPLLRTLVLRQCLPLAEEDPHRTVILPHLERISLRGEVLRCGLLLSYIQPSPRCCITLQCTGHTDPVSSVLAPSLKKHLAQTLPIHDMNIFYAGSDYLHICGKTRAPWTLSDDSSWGYSDSATVFSSMLKWDGPRKNTKRAMDSLLSSLDLSHLRELNLAVRSLPSKAFWPSIGSLPNLESLSLGLDPMPCVQFVRALGQVRRAKDIAPEPHFFR